MRVLLSAIFVIAVLLASANCRPGPKRDDNRRDHDRKVRSIRFHDIQDPEDSDLDHDRFYRDHDLRRPYPVYQKSEDAEYVEPNQRSFYQRQGEAELYDARVGQKSYNPSVAEFSENDIDGPYNNKKKIDEQFQATYDQGYQRPKEFEVESDRSNNPSRDYQPFVPRFEQPSEDSNDQYDEDDKDDIDDGQKNFDQKDDDSDIDDEDGDDMEEYPHVDEEDDEEDDDFLGDSSEESFDDDDDDLSRDSSEESFEDDDDDDDDEDTDQKWEDQRGNEDQVTSDEQNQSQWPDDKQEGESDGTGLINRRINLNSAKPLRGDSAPQYQRRPSRAGMRRPESEEMSSSDCVTLCDYVKTIGMRPTTQMRKVCGCEES